MNSDDRRYLIRFDWAMKRLLRQKSGFSILEGFLSELLGEDIRIEQLLESETNQEAPDTKFSRVDLLALNGRGELIVIEVQNESELDYFHRILFSSSRVLVEQLKLGEAYGEVKKIYSVNIVYFDLGQGEDYVYRGTTEFKGLHTGDTLRLSAAQKKGFRAQEVYEIFPEYYILRVNKFNDLAKDKLDEWIYYLKNNEIPESYSAKGLNLVREQLEVDRLSPSDRRAYYRAVEDRVIEQDVTRTGKLEAVEKAVQETEQRVRAETEQRVRAETEQRVRAETEQRMKEDQVRKALHRGRLTFEEIAEDSEVTLEFVRRVAAKGSDL